MKTWFGTMSISEDKMEEMIKAAIDAKYFGIDSAWIYKNEEVVGRALTNLSKQGYDIKVQTKIWPEDYENVAKAYDQMLKRLNLKQVYSLLLHRPTVDFNKTILAWKELIKLKESGKALHIGVSNFDKDMIKLLVRETGVKPEFNQVEMSVTNFRHDRLFFNNQEGIETQAWSPMGKDVPKNLNNIIVKRLALKYKVTPAQILLSFLTSQGIVPCSSAMTKQHIKQNIKYVKLDSKDIDKLMKLNVYDNRFEETYPE